MTEIRCEINPENKKLPKKHDFLAFAAQEYILYL